MNTIEPLLCELVIQKPITEKDTRYLCSALEGGSNYWYLIKDFKLASGQ